MFNFNKLFRRTKVGHQIGDPVVHKETNRYGKVTGVGRVKTITGIKIPVVSVAFRDGGHATLLPANEFTNLKRATYK